MEKQRRVHGVPERSAEFAHLPLMALRQYRKALTQEENRVSYWRRILQARLDVVRTLDPSAVPDVAALAPVLGSERVGAARQALLDVVPVDDIPPLPHLEALWDRDPRAGDDTWNASLVTDLEKAEAQLSAYRAALHRRLGSATNELIARYRDEPSLCLSALPLPREKRESHSA